MFHEIFLVVMKPHPGKGEDTPWKSNRSEIRGLEDEFPCQLGDFQVPCFFPGHMKFPARYSQSMTYLTLCGTEVALFLPIFGLGNLSQMAAMKANLSNPARLDFEVGQELCIPRKKDV